MYSVQLYTVAFQQFHMGYAAAMAWILFVIIFSLSLFAHPALQPVRPLRLEGSGAR